MKLNSNKKIILATIGSLMLLIAVIFGYFWIFEKDSFVVVLEKDGVLIDEVKDEVLTTAEEFEAKVKSGEITEDEMKLNVQKVLTESLRELVNEGEITQDDMSEQLENYYEATGEISDKQEQTLKSFCEQMQNNRGFNGPNSGNMSNRNFTSPTNGTLPQGQMPSGGSFDPTEMQSIMTEMQSLCNDNVYTSEEIARYEELQAAMPQRSQGGFMK